MNVGDGTQTATRHSKSKPIVHIQGIRSCNPRLGRYSVQHELCPRMLRAAVPVIRKGASLPRALCQGLEPMAGFSISEEHPKNYVFGDSLERQEELPHSKSPALEFQVRATAGRARAAQMQLPHFLCETPMFMPVGTQGEVRFVRLHSSSATQ